jgi:hypothetical protein
MFHELYGCTMELHATRNCLLVPLSLVRAMLTLHHPTVTPLTQTSGISSQAPLTTDETRLFEITMGASHDTRKLTVFH